MLQTYHFTYKVTNTKNDEYYFGMHSTQNLNDGYLGSGNRIKRSIKKHGKEFFNLEILSFFETRKLLIEAEKKLIILEILNDPLCLNLTLGGQGGNTHEWSKESREKSSKKLKNRINNWGNKVSKALKGKKPPVDRVLRAANSRRGERNGSWKNINLTHLEILKKEGFTIDKIAEKMDISRSTVKRKLKLINI
jgi:hypothetical protein